MQVMTHDSIGVRLRVPVKMWTDGVPVEEQALDQLANIAHMPFIHSHVAGMPDIHKGIGATVGSVIATKGAIIPAAVGVDIGCGMIAVKTSLRADDLPDSLSALRSAIEATVPVGFAMHQSLPMPVQQRWERLAPGLHDIQQKHPSIQHKAPEAQVGTLGGGNHFIEVCLDLEGNVWVMLHSGSRGIGNVIGRRFIEWAREDMRRWFINLPDQDLAYIPEGTELFADYWQALAWAQLYARLNRAAMMELVIGAMKQTLGRPFDLVEKAINCHHNYVSRENHFGANVLVTRKGAVSARKGELGIIPGSMGAKSFIVCGKGHAESFCSCSHGAGRKMSRTEARKRFTVEDHTLATLGVECRRDEGVIDETPGAYKDIDAVMAAQSDLVEVVAELRQVLCVKG
jgi:tRNA-splicing ligase RtcB